MWYGAVFEALLVKLSGRLTALALALSLVLTFSPLYSLPAAHAQEAYRITVEASWGNEATDVAVPIYLDGVDSGFSTPHDFAGLTSFHNFSVTNEHLSGDFVSDPPTLQSDPSTSFDLSSEGVNWIIIGPSNATNAHGTIKFTYGPVPFIENFRSTFEPGGLAKLGIRVYMDPSRVANGHLEVYDHNWPIETNATTPFYASNFTIRGVEPTYASFGIPMNAPIGTWGYTVRIIDANLDASVNATFDVAFPPALATINFPTADMLSYSSFNVANTQYAFFQNPNASDVVLYVGGGTIGKIGGPTPINGYSNVSDRNSATYRLIYNLYVNGFSIVIPQGPWEGLSFPSEVVDYLRSQGERNFYAIGHSAGGVVIANSVINDPGLFAKAVVADAPLTQESTGFYFTDLSIRSESVTIPHLLVWGRGDNQASIGDAYAWMDHANQSLATLKVFDYDHDWAGTTTEVQVSSQILNFLTEKSPTSMNSNDEIELSASPSILSGLVNVGMYAYTQDWGRFRNLVLETRFGSSLMEGFGAWWTDLGSSIRPSIAPLPVVEHTMRIAFYPMELMVTIGTLAFNFFPAELAAFVAATVASLLIGATYLGFAWTAIVARHSKMRRIARRLGKPFEVLLLGSFAGSVAAEVLGWQLLLLYSANAMVFATSVTAAFLSSRFMLRVAKFH